MKTLRVYNYEILNFEQEPVIFTSTGFTKLVDPKMTSTLVRLGSMNTQHLSEGDLESLLRSEDLQPEPATEFLKSLSVLGDEVSLPYLKRVVIFTDMVISESLKKFLEEQRRQRLQILPLPNDLPAIASSPTLFVFACMKLRPNSIKKMYTTVLQQNPGSAASIGFVSGNYFHLTEAHLPEIGNPCAFCTFDRISHYERLRSSHHYWSRIWAFCSAQNLDLPLTPINEYQRTLIFGAIVEFADKLTQAPKLRSTQDRILLSRTVNLQNGFLTEDSSIHWPLCECIGAEQ
ncbi:McbB family protein [Pseudomonas sp. NPDC089422]|uniref:McbB family protein n=1 Tax=Pseudomonas sp. NPDC089422 TaxID=3364466 RepID=UPI003823A791